MKVACPHCTKYYTLDQEKTCVVQEQGTVIICELCGKKSTVVIHAIPSESVARRIAIQSRECTSEQGGYSE